MIRLFRTSQSHDCIYKDDGTRYPIKGWQMWLAPRTHDSVTMVLYLVGIIAYIFCQVTDIYGPVEWWTGLPSLGLIFLFMTVDRYEYWRFGPILPSRYAIGSLLVRIFLVEMVGMFDVLTLSPYIHLTMIFPAYFFISNLAGYLMSAFVLIDFVIDLTVWKPSWYTDPETIHGLMLLFFVLLLFTGIVEMFRREQESHRRTERLLKELETSHRQLKIYSQQVGELAATEERNRLAREIHDSLGHYLTVVNVQLEKALVFFEKKPEEARQAIADSKRLAGEALVDIRASVSTLRNNQMPSLKEALERLCDNMAGSAFCVRLEIEGSEQGFSKPQLIALYRVAQEGLTNIQKHAGATDVSIQVNLQGDQAVMKLVDNGSGFDMASLDTLPIQRERSFGLQGLKERMELVRGNMEIISIPGKGTTLNATVPKDPFAVGPRLRFQNA